MQHTPTIFIIAGPTAVGKTAMAIQVAQHFKCSIISADSRQCYREMNIGVARPSAEELAAVHHYFIASHSIHEDVNAAVFEQYALQVAQQALAENPVLVMVGGTGLYIKAFMQGLDAIPAIPEALRKNISSTYVNEGIAWLQQQVQQHAPDAWQHIDQQNPQRLMRALEVQLHTGKSIIEWQQGAQVQRPFRMVPIVLELDRALLHERINQRVLSMMDAGLLDEVATLQPFAHLNALQTVGYTELFSYLRGDIHLPQGIAQIQAHTRQYAKRQITWFKHQWEATHFNATNVAAVIDYCEQHLALKH